jgi:poly(glycerol-phosphate) alpha-glucosyltransferase
VSNLEPASPAAVPDAEYLILSSRLIPDLDGGYTLATLARARQMAASGVHGGLGPQLLTVDPGTPEDHAAHRAEFAARGLASPARLRNLFDEAAEPAGGAAEWLRAAATPGEADPALPYREIADVAGRPVLALPVISGNPDWHTTTAPVIVYDADGSAAGIIAGFGGLYRAWLDHIVAELGSTRPVVLICESRQLGELLADWNDPNVRIIHAIHTIHLEPPFTADAPLNTLWSRWFTVADRFDAVLWPTQSQRDDVVARFGSSNGGTLHAVVPHAVEAAASIPDFHNRVPGRVVMLNRLAPGKRVDIAVRAFVDVIAEAPHARLDIYGSGAEHDALQELIDAIGIGTHVTLRGATNDPRAVLDEASVFLSTSAFEGQGLSIAEALTHGCPVVAFDIRYGPRDLLAAGGGVLVPDHDVAALAEALIELLNDDALRARLSSEGADAAASVGPERVMAALADTVTAALARPSRRA